MVCRSDDYVGLSAAVAGGVDDLALANAEIARQVLLKEGPERRLRAGCSAVPLVLEPRARIGEFPDHLLL
jgi:hypothetical protein